MNVEVEIYMNNLIKFFRENPNDLINLIPKDKEDEFFRKIRLVAGMNSEKGDEVALTKTQIMNICLEINGKPPRTINQGVFQETKFGTFCLN